MHFVGLLWPLLTSRSAGRPNSAMPASPFQASGETSPGKNDDLPRTIAGSTPLPLGRRSFAVSGPLAPVRSASYPVPVRRLTRFVSRFVQPTPHDERLALPFGPCDQVPGGLSPPSHRPCRAHHKKGGWEDLPAPQGQLAAATSAPHRASGSGLIWKCTTLLGVPGPVSRWNGARVL